ncbi:YidB family protein [Sphaerotilus mobilis]|uniref:Uncharacterized protein YidB (DUF937 family) n=1 Tax=Sphaerotilus mobilis TaxID=47994 RepID=A0A4V2EWR4_9BURK|nr:YidB family protein [Sphaerotilus mobilis]RZS56900.1 uncharacterized protein YidB (DUF937 family) [Sphaerotilus mobilis]
MGLFDSVAGQLLGAVTQGAGASADAQGGLIEAIGGLLNNPATGGIQGLVSTFEQQGLGGVIQSWISTGQNLPISAEQIQAVLGSSQVQGIAQSLGLSPDAVGGQLASLLPQVIDGLTPGGQLPEAGGGLDLSSLGGLLGMLGNKG